MAKEARPLPRPKRIVVKIGSSLLRDNAKVFSQKICNDYCKLPSPRPELVIVSSGAIALGFRSLGKTRPKDLPSLQASAAVGQPLMFQHWRDAFATNGKQCAQILLTHQDLADRTRYLNARNAIRVLLNAGIVPIVNENDSVSTEEITYGDNDQLAALVCNLVSADTLIICTDVDGLHSAPPNEGGIRIPLVKEIATEARPFASAQSSSGVGTGGMQSKIVAAEKAAHSGVSTLIVDGKDSLIVSRSLAGEDLGTLIVPTEVQLQSRKHWLAFGTKPRGVLLVDAGAEEAICKHGTSLLPAGLLSVEGDFAHGAVVSLVGPSKSEFARGLSAYSSLDLRTIQGCSSSRIEAHLGYKHLDEVVHRDDLVLTLHLSA